MTGQPGLDVSIFDMIIEAGDAQARMQLAIELARLASDRQAPENERQCVIPTLLKLASDPVKDIRIMQARRASSQVHQLMAERGWVPANDAADMVAAAEERAILQILESANEAELPPLIRFMASRSMLTASIIMRSACAGHMRIIE